ncbi:copper resistance protein CopC, partial [Acinetobacter baumannii]
TVTQRLKPLTSPGHYVVSYRVTSTDSHPVTRQLGFDYLVRSAPSASPTASASGSANIGPIIATVALVAVLVAVLAWAVVRRRPGREVDTD